MKAPMFAPLAAAALLAASALAEDPAKSSNLEDGLKAAKRSGKPVLVVTTWKPGV